MVDYISEYPPITIGDGEASSFFIESPGRSFVPADYTWLMIVEDEVNAYSRQGKVIHYHTGKRGIFNPGGPKDWILCWKYLDYDHKPGEVFRATHKTEVVTCQECNELIHS